MTCPSCGSDNRSGTKFCVRCGTRLALACPGCGSPIEGGELFCGECGLALRPAQSGDRPALPPQPQSEPPTSERRLVTVLFADLVGFTSYAAERDAEEVRETLSRYFELASDIVARYGGTIEKFIGDAVMAVWGAPTALEDDAERAVRAGLELVDAVHTLGDGIDARAGVLTGEAAVTLGATNQGIVAGDMVNTASRLQSVAPPGTVLVGETTQRTASGAIVFEAAGEQVLKGKTAPVAAWRAVRVVAERGGRNRTDMLEAPFVGREDELRLLKDLYHATVRERRTRLVSIVGPGGIGKTRLAWEFLKYCDGLVDTVYWHDGRSPAYGEGITFWALGEMVRARAGLLSTDDEAATRTKIAEALTRYVPDEEEQRWIEPALLALLGFEAGVETDRLFGAWRTFFERLAAGAPVVMVFEDFHFADPGLLDFVDHLLEWSRTVPIYVLTLARPELLEKRPDWGAGKRNFVSLALEPLGEEPMRELLAGLVPGLPDRAAASIIARADGIPLYAVETVRMLVAEGRLRLDADRYVPTGDLDDLAVPETLVALIGSRLDTLGPEDRGLIQDAAVLGQSFTPQALAAVAGGSEDELASRLRTLVRRELLRLEADPRSPERGQYAFVQALIREVAYNTLAKRERKSRHLAAARFFEGLGSDELAGALAGHYLAAHANAAEGPESDALAGQARIALRAAAERAISLRAPEQAVGYLEQALRVTPDAVEQAHLHEEAARAATLAGFTSGAEQHAESALAIHRANADPDGIARMVAVVGNILLLRSRTDEAVDALTSAIEGMSNADRDPAAVELMSQLARAEMFRSRPRAAIDWLERGLDAAARLDLVQFVAELLVTRAWAVGALGRMREAMAISEGAIAMSAEHDLVLTEIRARNNLGTWLGWYAPRRALEVIEPAVALVLRLGHRDWLAKLAFRSFVAFEAGEWDRAAAIIDEQLNDDLPTLSWLPLTSVAAILDAWRGSADAATDRLRQARERLVAGATEQDLNAVAWAETHASLAAGRLENAARGAIEQRRTGQLMGDAAYGTWVAGAVAAWSDDRDAVRTASEQLAREPGVFESIAGMKKHLSAAIAAFDGRSREAAVLFAAAAETFRATGMSWALAMCLADTAVLLPPDDAVGLEALAEVHRLASGWGATVLLERIDERLARRDTQPADQPDGPRRIPRRGARNWWPG